MPQCDDRRWETREHPDPHGALLAAMRGVELLQAAGTAARYAPCSEACHHNPHLKTTHAHSTNGHSPAELPCPWRRCAAEGVALLFAAKTGDQMGLARVRPRHLPWRCRHPTTTSHQRVLCLPALSDPCARQPVPSPTLARRPMCVVPHALVAVAQLHVHAAGPQANE